ncbi:WRKY DNA-binding transcription factor 70-like [Henckelia pumila]|uniref:WRKY DNA-binding transcription factor 70-like n=1 Tax=Henckelia pumila TaxID=405737 RepID=UPI003C6DD30C
MWGVGGSERVMEELIQGRHYAHQLRDMLRYHDDSSCATSNLVDKILHSFTHSLSILQLPLKSPTTPMHKDHRRRGCYKRRKTSEIVIKETTSLVEDGHAWRKYGQKLEITTDALTSLIRDAKLQNK